MSSRKDVDDKTDRVIQMAVARAIELDIGKIIVASCSGRTAMKLIGCGLAVVCVTHQVGFYKPGADEMGADMRRTLQEKGVELLTTTHFMAGIDPGASYAIWRYISLGDCRNYTSYVRRRHQGVHRDQHHGNGCGTCRTR